MSAAGAAFKSLSSLSLDETPSAVPPDQQGRRRLPNSYLIERSKISPDPLQPRKQFDEQELNELAASMRSRGIKQPITVRWHVESSRYRIIVGGRRYLASEKAGLTELPCWIQEGDSKEILVDQIVHNWQRADLKPEETADALARLRDEFGLAQKAISELTGKPQSEISKFLAIHDWVAPDVQKMAREQSGSETPLSMRHLYNISKLEDPAAQKALAKRVRDEKLTATQVEELVAKPRRQTARRIGGVSLRQRRYQTTHAEVVITFRRPSVTRAELLQVLDEIRESVESSDADLD